MATEWRSRLNEAPSGGYSDLLRVDFKDIAKARQMVGDLAVYFSESVEYGLNQLGKAGVNSQRRAIRDATTSWGQKRMRGEAKGISFAPYGRSAGREETGMMYDEVGYEWKNSPAYQSISVGWSLAEDYFWWQEYGFQSKTRFRGATKGGAPIFGISKKTYFVEGAQSLAAASKTINRLIPSFMSGAWNEAVRKLSSRGGTF